ncbi:hypothetical protein ACVWXM_003233 [Bradyrhizobium sp. GM7.3]
MIWFRPANSHTGPQLHRCTIRGRTDGSIRLCADLLQKSLASRGASTDESCPRRFFYTHVLQVGGRRTATAFMHLHEAVRVVVDGVIASDSPVAERDLEAHIDAALAGQGLADHGYRAEFRDLALAMLRFLLDNRADAVAEAPVALSLNFGGEEIVVRPDEVLVRPDGVRAVRRKAKPCGGRKRGLRV